jgi:NAD(P)-dependent dehydrogenase (short-subunit alcohol dehydrogenase family)
MPTVLVTGAASGIGAASSSLLEQRGWTVIRTDIAKGEGITALDVTNPQQWNELLERSGPIDALVHSAGIRERGALLDLSPEQWAKTINVNLNGSFYGVQAFAKSAVQNGIDGSIVLIASVNSFAPSVGQAHYVASKGGVAQLTKAAALELAEHGIRVNAIAPGSINTPMQEARRSEPGRAEQQLARIPLGRLGQPDDIAEAVSYLVSPAATYVTGIIMPVDGGFLLR